MSALEPLLRIPTSRGQAVSVSLLDRRSATKNALQLALLLRRRIPRINFEPYDVAVHRRPGREYRGKWEQSLVCWSEQKTPVGVLLAHFRPPNFPAEPNSVFYVSAIAVDEGLKNHRIGRHMLELWLTLTYRRPEIQSGEAKGHALMTMTGQRNASVRRIYTELGFGITGWVGNDVVMTRGIAMPVHGSFLTNGLALGSANEGLHF